MKAIVGFEVSGYAGLCEVMGLMPKCASSCMHLDFASGLCELIQTALRCGIIRSLMIGKRLKVIIKVCRVRVWNIFADSLFILCPEWLLTPRA